MLVPLLTAACLAQTSLLDADQRISKLGVVQEVCATGREDMPALPADGKLV